MWVKHLVVCYGVDKFLNAQTAAKLLKCVACACVHLCVCLRHILELKPGADLEAFAALC